MLPDWMLKKDNYLTPNDNGAFIVKTMKAIGKAMARISAQKGHEKKHALPVLLKLIGLIVFIVVLSACKNKLIIMAMSAAVLVYLCTWPAEDILNIIRKSLTAALISLLIFLPAMIIKPAGIPNNIVVFCKVFITIAILSIFNHTTQWNHITSALKKLHIPSVFIFTLDITLKYIVLLGNLINDLLTSMLLRSVGKNNRKYTSVGAVMGVTFTRGAEMNRQMYEAMQCRGFTDDYSGL